MKIVVNSAMVAHLWANQSQSEARNAGNSFYFRDSIIYSYGSHFPIARHVKTLSGEAVTLMTTRTYSSTTHTHLGHTRRAIRHLTVLHCENPRAESQAEHTKNLLAIREQCYEYLAKATRSRIHTSWLIEQAEAQAVSHTNYRKAFGLDLDADLVIQENWKAQVKGRVEAQKELAKEQAKQKELAEQKCKADALEDMEKWKRGEIMYRSGFGNYGIPVALRPTSDYTEIETSQGASVPTSHAQRIYRLVCKIMQTGTPYQRNGHTEHVGQFTVESISVDGTLIAGCHTIEFPVMKELAERLGW